ncbi:glycosyltransferase family 39 protein, partial [Candidatus Woesebacteria bacterium]|nr:glycosyltransferase family 39 protein [Candidatus Woesebacteria bacterium]
KFNKRSKYLFLIILILLGALLVRLWGIGFGLPQIQIIDESGNVYFAFYTAANGLRPLRYFYGPLIPYILVLEYGVYFVLGKLAGFFSTPTNFFISYLSNPTPFLIIGRVTMAIAGVISVWLMWRIGTKFFSKRVGLISAFFLAFTFLHVRESHYIKEDVLAGLFVLATFYECLVILKNRSLKHYVLSGIFFALALAAKYPAGLILPVVLIAHFIAVRRKLGLKELLIFAISSALTFFITNPYFAIEFKESLIKTIVESGINRIVYPEYLQGKPVWLWFASVHIPQGIGIPLFIASAVGFLLIIVKAKTKKEYVLIPIMPFLFFTTIDLWSKYHFARYSVMILPFFALSAAILLDKTGERIKDKQKRTLFLLFASLFLIAQSFLRVLKFDRIITSPDTRAISAKWVESNIPQGAKILVESTIKPEYPSQLGTPLVLAEKGIDRRIEDSRKVGYPATYLTSLKIANQGKIGFDIISTPRIDLKDNIITGEQSFLESAKYYQDIKAEYLILSSWAIEPGIKKDFKETILDYYKPIAQFRSKPELRSDPLWVDIDYENLDKINIFDRSLVFGPVINIYQLKSSSK